MNITTCACIALYGALHRASRRVIVELELQALTDPTPTALLAPIAVSLGLMLLFGGVAVFVMPGLIRAVMPRLQEHQQPYVLLGAVSLVANTSHTQLLS